MSIAGFIPSVRKTSALFAAFCLLLIIMAGILQSFFHLTPCPLCIMQRILVVIIGVCFFLGSLFVPLPKARRMYYCFVFLLCALGLAIASRQIWIEHQPLDQVNSCGADLIYMLENFPLRKTLELVFQGTGECIKQNWSMLGLGVAEWSAIGFVILLLGSLLQIVRKDRF